MKLKWGMILLAGLLAVQVSAEERPALNEKKERVSYGIGIDIARNLKRNGIDVDVGSMTRGLKDALSGGKPLFSENELKAAMTVFHVELGWKGTQTKQASPSVSYGIGIDAGRVLSLYEIKVDSDLLIKGIDDVLSGEKLLLTEEELRTATAAFQLQVKQNHPKISRVKRDNRRASETVFLSSNKTKENTITLPSGLQYKVLKPGEGKKPTNADRVEVHYLGTFIDATEFGNSFRNGKPVTFKVTEAIPGWREALKLMPVGSKWQLFIPSNLAFRSRGWGLSGWPTLPLISELQLLAIK